MGDYSHWGLNSVHVVYYIAISPISCTAAFLFGLTVLGMIYMDLMSDSPLKDPLPWASCPLSINLTNYEEECEKATPTQYFWYRKTLNISPSIEESGSIQWEQAACLILAWLVVYLCILRGTEYTGKVRNVLGLNILGFHKYN